LNFHLRLILDRGLTFLQEQRYNAETMYDNARFCRQEKMPLSTEKLK
jgi:hypothetical protein